MFSALPYGILRDIVKAEDKNSCGNSFAGVQGGRENENQGQI
jgi:hypothetical protein